MVMIHLLALLWACGDTNLDGDAFSGEDDCNDLDPAVPMGHELCNGRDDDCNGTIDDNAVDGLAGFADGDGDGYGDADSPMTGCELGSGFVADDTDCDDSDASARPFATEWCDGVDNDCDGQVDESPRDGSTWYVDGDNDGYGDVDVVLVDCSAAAPSGHSAVAGDCNDFDPDRSPAASEVCGNGADDDCDGQTDEDPPVWYLDTDNDGFGDAASPVTGCSAPSGAVADDTDCDDTTDLVYPGEVERCNGADDDCDGAIDEDPVDGSPFYVDGDGDGWGNATAEFFCSRPPGYTERTGDCSPDPLVNPGAVEVCNNEVDDDCDGDADECRYDFVSRPTETPFFAEGDYPNGRLGRRIAAADFNGDGVVDLAACGEHEGVLAPSGGALSVWSGPLSTPGGAPHLQLASSVTDQRTCYGLEAGPDFDGDGIEDVAIASGDFSITQRVWLLSANATGIQDIDEAARLVVEGSAAGNNLGFGYSLALAGDVVGDSAPDLVIGSGSDSTWVVDGNTTGTIHVDDADARVRGLPTASPGESVWTGDFDGDGVDELLAGTHRDNHNLVGAAGAVFALSRPVVGEVSADLSYEWVVRGSSENEQLGGSIEVGDVDGDGSADLIVGAPTRNFAGEPQGRVHVILGPIASGEHFADDARVGSFTGVPGSGGFGRALELLGDVDGDGVVDLGVGDPGWDEFTTNAGAMHLLYGPLNGEHDVYDPGSVRFEAHVSYTNFGASIAPLGDVDGDGIDDFAVGATEWDRSPATRRHGAVWLIYGQSI